MSPSDLPVRAVWREVESGNYTAAIRNKNALIQTLDHGSDTDRECAARALAFLSFEYPDEVHEALSIAIDAATEARRQSVRGNAMSIVAAVAREYPNDVARHSKTISQALTDPHETVVTNAIEALAFTTRPAPQGVLDVLDEVSHLLKSTDSNVRRYASIVIYNLAIGYSDHVVRFDETLLRQLSVDTDDISKVAISGALYRMADQHPDRFVSKIDEFESLLRAETDARIEGNIIGILAKIGEEYPEEIRPHLLMLSERLQSATDENTLVNATNAISHIAEIDPEAVRKSGIVPELRNLWDRTESPVLRENISHVASQVASEGRQESSPHGRWEPSGFPAGMIKEAKRLANESTRQVVLDIENIFNDMSEGDETTVEVVDSAAEVNIDRQSNPDH